MNFLIPWDIGEFQRSPGDEDAGNVEADDYRPGSILYDNIHKPLDDCLRGRGDLPSNGTKRLGVREGRPYSITGQWAGSLEGRVYANASRGRYI